MAASPTTAAAAPLAQVQIYRLVTNGTYEQRMFERACQKLSLEHALLQGRFGDGESGGGGGGGVGREGGGGGGGQQRMSRSDMEELLRFGAHGMLKEDDEAVRG